MLGAILHAGADDRLLQHRSERETWQDYLSTTGVVSARGEELIDRLEGDDLRGRGGGGFPAHRKWRAVAAADAPRVVVANGEEGEPLSVKDRYLLRLRPHLVIDGLLLAIEAVGAGRGIIYLSDVDAEIAVRSALTERSDADGVEVFRVAREYVAGEESACVRALSGGPALPSEKPPRPFERGVDGRPTLVQNVETLARAAWLARQPGESLPRYGTALVTVSGDCAHPGLYEARLGTPLKEMLTRSGAPGDLRGVMLGGYFAGLVGRRALDLSLDFDELRREGTGLGCSAMLVLGPNRCGVGIAAAVLDFFAGASSRQCGSCLKGTAAMASAAQRLADSAPEPEDVTRLQRWSETLKGRGACSLLDGAAQTAGALLREFPFDVALHASGGRCSRCHDADHHAFISATADVHLVSDVKDPT
ncbi:NADH-ubiquinone oxidoreductase-F iron-sulfur binding region domain-containing protein [Nocardia sp. NPDC050408]|uniref:NADH-ubiquinone oxidoreductase-F iron-sulfur binding region domain-containing protein n=1 Tax=Nocardia sp. NPDC050408 TaxID=3364319 RepID=UPI0037941BC1